MLYYVLEKCNSRVQADVPQGRKDMEMKLTLEGLQNKEAFMTASIQLPAYDIDHVREATCATPHWVHFGIGNIFRIFLGTIAEDLIAAGEMKTGINCIETFDFDVVDKIYRPYDNLALCVTLHNDGTTDERVVASLAEAVAVRPADMNARKRAEELFRAASLQMVSFTITEKGYELRDADGNYLPHVKADLENGPAGELHSAMTLLTALLVKRFHAGGNPIAMVSMDNVSENGSKLRASVLEVARVWREEGFIEQDILDYLKDETRVSFPWTMIDKITPRPSEEVGEALTAKGLEDMDIVVTDKRTYIAPFVNAEKPQYLVIEDSFPNGRPPLEKAGVYMTDRATVNASERMKVTVCLNPVHSALGPYGVVLGIERFSDVMQDTILNRLAVQVGEKEGMEVVVDPGILSPAAFLKEVLTERFPNPYIPDTSQRLCTDISQGLSVRFGVTIRAFYNKYGSAERLTGIALAIAGWLRYLLGVTEEGTPYELAPDPLNAGLQKTLLDKGITVGHPEAVEDHLRPILSNENIFGIDLYEAGLGDRIEAIFREEIAGFGAVRKVLQQYLT